LRHGIRNLRQAFLFCGGLVLFLCIKAIKRSFFVPEIVYFYGNALYLNITNQCPCRCSFCIREETRGLGSADSLWLEKEPSAEDIIAALRDCNLAAYAEAVFCGYGEPFCALDTLLAVCRFLKSRNMRVRINTNGLGSLINKKDVPPLLDGLADAVSVSLNAPDSRRYAELCRPVFGDAAFDAVIAFAKECKEYVPDITFTVVDVLREEEIKACKKIARAAGLPLRVRKVI
jgi:radical SAM enzyme (TIGR04100 family)